MPIQTPILRAHNLRVDRGKCRILRGLSWTVNSGQHWTILGANGSGKTSLLKSITGYLLPSAGTIQVLGQTFGESDWRDLRKHVGLVSSAVGQLIPGDEPALDTVMSGATAMIGYWSRVARPNWAAARKHLRQLGCSRLAERPWRVLSQGERQRVLIARALMACPAILILDEPCAGLDPVAREHFLQFLNGLGRRRTSPTLILVTHHVEEIMPSFGHVLVLKAGRVLASGSKKALMTSKVMGAAFGERIRIESSSAGRYALRISHGRGRVV